MPGWLTVLLTAAVVAPAAGWAARRYPNAVLAEVKERLAAANKALAAAAVQRDAAMLRATHADDERDAAVAQLTEVVADLQELVRAVEDGALPAVTLRRLRRLLANHQDPGVRL